MTRHYPRVRIPHITTSPPWAKAARWKPSVTPNPLVPVTTETTPTPTAAAAPTAAAVPAAPAAAAPAAGGRLIPSSCPTYWLCPASSSWQGFFLFDVGGGGVGVPGGGLRGAGSRRWSRGGARCCIRCGSPRLARPASMRRAGVRASTSRTRVPGTRSGVVFGPVCGRVAVQGER